jgi:hypothetical protein
VATVATVEKAIRETHPCRHRLQCRVLQAPTFIPIDCIAIPTLNAQFAKTRAERRRT